MSKKDEGNVPSFIKHLNTKDDLADYVSSGHFKKYEVPRIGGSILGLLEEMVGVEQIMGYKMEGCQRVVKELCNKNKVNFLSLQETKMETMDLFSVKRCWGNLSFDYVHSEAVGNSRGILCVWDPNSFHKENSTISDSFVMVRVVWCPMGQKFMLIAVYAPYDSRAKHMLWDYLQNEILKWKGEVVVMEDFNEVRFKSDRFGSVFNAHEANVFNSFITNSNMVEVNLGGCSYTWCHKSAIKMSKLDRFLISDSLMNSCSNINAISLELKGLSRSAGRTKLRVPIDLPSVFRPFWDLIKSDVFDAVRPICLVGSLYKIIAKILANRLVGVLNSIVNEVQSAFISDRQILDGPFILNEVLQWCKSKHKQALIFKVDFEKAYDSVKWDFLDDVLNKFGFGNKWCKSIQCCLRSSRGSILVNGSPTEEFQFGKGLKQGDPLSPLLFIMVMESLHISFQLIVDAGRFHDIKMGGGLVNLSHMFYSDDVVFIGQWCESNITTPVHVLECFHKASRLRINMLLKTPFSYLGSIVGGSMHRRQYWIDIVDKVKKRLSKWKLQSLSIEGRLTLTIFNGYEPNSKKVNWVSWEKVSLAKERDGLGVYSLFAMNIGLLFKWIWKFRTQGNSLWARIIKDIHGVDECVGGNSMVRNPSCWMSIIKEMDVLKTKGIDLMKHMRIKVGNGESTSFWEDKWCDAGVLKDRRLPRGGCEKNQVNELEDLMRLVVLSPIEDRWMWGLENSGLFPVASIRRHIDDKMRSGWNCKTRWINYVPIKVNVLAWKVMTDSLPTRFNISRRGIPIDSILCVNCDMGVETSRHLFFSCRMANEVTNLIARLWDVPEPECESYKEWLVWVTNVRLPLKNKKLFEESDATETETKVVVATEAEAGEDRQHRRERWNGNIDKRDGSIRGRGRWGSAAETVTVVNAVIIISLATKREALMNCNIDELGDIMMETWRLHQELDPHCSNEFVDSLFAFADRYCCGYKLVGAGGGGFALLLAKNYEDDVEDEERIDDIDEDDDEDYGTGQGSRSKRQRSDFIDDAAGKSKMRRRRRRMKMTMRITVVAKAGGEVRKRQRMRLVFFMRRLLLTIRKMTRRRKKPRTVSHE
nr:RNA-directed DNA polymerase, eukaryota [Tanacetum cinerariifolium]